MSRDSRSVMPEERKLKRRLTKTSVTGVNAMKKELITQIDKYFYGIGGDANHRNRFQNIEGIEFYTISTALDPRFKLKVLGAEAAKVTTETLVDKVYNILENDDASVVSGSPPAKKSKMGGFFSDLDELLETSASVSNPTEGDSLIDNPKKALGVVNSYLAETLIDSESDPLSFWKMKEKELSPLAKNSKFQLSRINDFRVDLNIPTPSAILAGNDATKNRSGTKKRKLEDAADTGDGVSDTKVMAFVNGVETRNKNIIELVEIVKPVVCEIVENVNKVKMWISLFIPRIEDGKNLILEETLAELRTVEAEASSFFDQISQYSITRGKIVVRRVAKYLHVEDYRESIKVLDENEFLNLRWVLMEVRNHYSTMHDMIVKNFE